MFWSPRMRVKVEAPYHTSFTKKLFIKITSCQIKHGLFFYLINASSSSSRRTGLDLDISGVACQKVSVQSRAVAHPFGGPPPNSYWAIRALCTCVSARVCTHTASGVQVLSTPSSLPPTPPAVLVPTGEWIQGERPTQTCVAQGSTYAREL